MKKTLAATLSFVLLTPLVASAQLARVTDVNSLFTKISDIVNNSVWVLIGIALLFIVWNAFQFIRQTDGSERATYRSAILWGILGLFIILSIWGLVAILSNTFGLGNSLNDNNGQATKDVNSLILQNPNGASSANSTTCPPGETLVNGQCLLNGD